MLPLTHRLLLGAVHAQSSWRHSIHAGQPPGPPAPPVPDPDPGPAPTPGPVPAEDEGMFVTYLLLATFLVSMAGLMSGLTLGLMSLDQVDLEILRRSGTERQKRLAQRIQPVLHRPHVLLVTLLVCNAAAAEALPLVLDRLADPVTAVLVSVTVVLLFGEIIPQAACSRYGLQIGAYSAPFVRLLIMLTAPISFPIGWVLDRVLGHRHTALFRRAELKALVDIHREGQEFGGQLSADEVSIIKGALDMTHKTARNAMTPIDMVFMLPSDAVLDERTLTAIMASGHSRIPVHRPGDRRSILGIMLVKELLLVDKGSGKTVGRQKVRSIPYVRADTPLYDMLKLFEIGRSHMAVLMQLKKEAEQRRKRRNEEELMVHIDSMSDDPSTEGGEEGEGADEEEGLLSPRPTARPEDFIFDPTDFEPVGIITIEDVLEELLQAEILDETDQFVDNLQSTPINAAILMRSLPPHLRQVLSARSLLPRIGGAAFMHETHGSGAVVVGGWGLADGSEVAGGLKGARQQGAAVAAAAAVGNSGVVAAVVDGAGTAANDGSPAAAAAATAAAAGAAAGAGAAGGTARSPPKQGGVPPLSPRAPGQIGSGAVSPVLGGPRQQRSLSGRAAGGVGGIAGGGGSTTGSVQGGLMYKQGSVGAALVAEALRQEVAKQLAAAAAATAGSSARPVPSAAAAKAPRSRSRSPLPGRLSLSSPEENGLLQPASSGSSSLAAQAGPSPSTGGGGGGASNQQQQQQQDGVLPPLFPGVRRSRSDVAAISGASTPRIVVPLPPPPARRSTNVSQRVQEQMDLLEPLLISSRRSTAASGLSMETEPSDGPGTGELPPAR